MKNKIKIFLWKMMYFILGIIENVISLLSLGYICPAFKLWALRKLTKKKYFIIKKSTNWTSKRYNGSNFKY